MIKYKKEVFVFIVLSVVLFFMNMSYFNGIVLFSENATQIYYTSENDVFYFMVLNSLLFLFISICAFIIVIKLTKPTISRVVLFYIAAYFVLLVTLSIKKITTTGSVDLSIEKYPLYLVFSYLFCFIISSIVIVITSSAKYKKITGDMDMRLKYFFILMFQFIWYMPVFFLFHESSLILLFIFILPIIFYNVACLNHFNKNKMIVLWIFIPFIAIFIPFFLKNNNNINRI